MCEDNEVRQSYVSDVTDAQWQHLELLIPSTEGRPAIIPRREIVNAIFYVLRAGCPWRLLPHDFPKWQTVYSYFRDWKRDGIWERIHTTPRSPSLAFSNCSTPVGWDSWGLG
jgi:putative transposase